MISLILRYGSLSAAVSVALYAVLLGLLTTTTFQAHVVYLHKIQFTWFKDLDVPELFGFLHNQVTPFAIKSSNGELYAWHIIPTELYREHESKLIAEPSGFAHYIESRLAFELLREDPQARLILHYHGAGGTVGSGYRTPNYRALSAGQPDKMHVLTFDYRGFGRSSSSSSSTGIPSERSVISDALVVAGIPSSRILLFGQSLGTAVSLAVAEHYASQSPAILFAGSVLVAPFVDVATLVATYRVAGTIPILSPVARFPALFAYLKSFVQDEWSSKHRIDRYVRANEANAESYRLTIIHAEDDNTIPSYHSKILFWHAVNATTSGGIEYDELEAKKKDIVANLGAAGSSIEWRTENGIIREEILKTGVHDVIMGYPIITMAVMRIFSAADLSFK